MGRSTIGSARVHIARAPTLSVPLSLEVPAALCYYTSDTLFLVQKHEAGCLAACLQAVTALQAALTVAE